MPLQKNLQKNRPSHRPDQRSGAHWDDVETGDAVHLGRDGRLEHGRLQRARRAGTDAMAATDAMATDAEACPDDCHYCSGPETD